jgi:hypothetical protein
MSNFLVLVIILIAYVAMAAVGFFLFYNVMS